MKILQLESENFKRLKAVCITPKGHLVQITGRNANGKSSIGDSIKAALGGANFIPGEPVRKGCSSARIKLDLGDLLVTRTITAKGQSVTVEGIADEQGNRPKLSGPQGILDALRGTLAFDPLAFARLGGNAAGRREQFDQLRRISGMSPDINLDELDRLNKQDFDRRTDINRDAKQARAQVEGIVIPAGAAAPVDVAQALQEVQALQNRQNTSRRAQQAMEDRERVISQKRAQVEELRTKAMALQEEIKILKADVENAVIPEDGAALAEQIEKLATTIREAQTINEAASNAKMQAQRKSDLEAQAAKMEAQAQALTEAMEARAAVKAKAISEAKVPVPGLSFGEGIVLFNGVPFDQASSAEQLKVSVAIGMAANSKLRVMWIQDGSLLDSSSLQVISDMAETQDYQVWIEQVGETGRVGIVIEDGMVAADNQVEEAGEAIA